MLCVFFCVLPSILPNCGEKKLVTDSRVVSAVSILQEFEELAKLTMNTVYVKECTPADIGVIGEIWSHLSGVLRSRTGGTARLALEQIEPLFVMKSICDMYEAAHRVVVFEDSNSSSRKQMSTIEVDAYAAMSSAVKKAVDIYSVIDKDGLELVSADVDAVQTQPAASSYWRK